MAKISKEEKKRYKIVARILGILVRIANICTWIGVGAVVAATVAVSIIAPNVKIDSTNKEISLFGNTATYALGDQAFEYTNDEGDYVSLQDGILTMSNKEIEFISIKVSEDGFTGLEKFVEEDAPRILAFLPFVLAMVAVCLGCYALALGHGASVLKNIAKEDTPFVKNNIERVEKAFKYLIAGFILIFVADLTVAIVSGFRTNVGAETTSITGILGTYVLIYIFKAGYQLEDGKPKE